MLSYELLFLHGGVWDLSRLSTLISSDVQEEISKVNVLVVSGGEDMLL